MCVCVCVCVCVCARVCVRESVGVSSHLVTCMDWHSVLRVVVILSLKAWRILQMVCNEPRNWVGPPWGYYYYLQGLSGVGGLSNVSSTKLSKI